MARKFVFHTKYHYPLGMNAEHVAEIMGICLPKARNIIRRKDFPKFKDGNRIVIPRDAFFDWFNSCGGTYNKQGDHHAV